MKRDYQEVKIQLYFFIAADIVTISDDATEDIFDPNK